MDLFEIGNELKWIGQLLETIRNASKGHQTDFRYAPYNNDSTLLQYLLNEKISELIELNKSSHK